MGLSSIGPTTMALIFALVVSFVAIYMIIIFAIIRKKIYNIAYELGEQKEDTKIVDSLMIILLILSFLFFPPITLLIILYYALKTKKIVDKILQKIKLKQGE